MGNISKCLENINDVYYKSGMFVESFYIYMDLENIRKRITVRSTCNTIPVAEHVQEIYIQIIMVK